VALFNIGIREKKLMEAFWDNVYGDEMDIDKGRADTVEALYRTCKENGQNYLLTVLSHNYQS